jgi:hypothetical protein
VAGIIAAQAGYPSVFLFGMLCGLAGMVPSVLTHRLPGVH